MRQLKAHWIGPLSYRGSLYKMEAGVYLIMAGQDVLFAGGEANVNMTLNKHIVFSERGYASAHDLVGRELMHYTRRYNERLTVKLGEVKDAETGAVIKDQDTLDDLVHLLIFSLRPPCNVYGKEEYDGYQSLTLLSSGKHFPVPAKLTVVPTHGRPRPERMVAPPPAAPAAAAPGAAKPGGDPWRESFD